MTNEELIVIYKQTKKQEILTEIIEKNQGLIHMIARTYNIEGLKLVEYDDLFQEGSIGLMIAVNKYDLNKDNSANFSTYAVYWIKSKISRYLKKRIVHEDSLNEPVGKDDESLNERIDLLKDNTDPIASVIENEFNKWLREEEEKLMRSELTLKQRETLKMLYGWESKPMTLKDTSEALQISYRGISEIRDSALFKLRHTDFMKKLYRDFAKESITKAMYGKADLFVSKLEYEYEKYKFIFK